jgi:hypothetical protein
MVFEYIGINNMTDEEKKALYDRLVEYERKLKEGKAEAVKEEPAASPAPAEEDPGDTLDRLLGHYR